MGRGVSKRITAIEFSLLKVKTETKKIYKLYKYAILLCKTAINF